jgi:hypothetical protein
VGAPWTASATLPRPPEEAEVAQLATRVREAPRGLPVASWGAALAPAAAAAFALAAGWPVLADPLSGARRGPQAVSTYDALLRAPASPPPTGPTWCRGSAQRGRHRAALDAVAAALRAGLSASSGRSRW